MIADQHHLYAGPKRRESTDISAARQFVRELAPQDFLVLAYMVGLNVAVLTAPPSPARAEILASIAVLLFGQMACVAAVRSKWLTHRWAAPALYRLMTYGCVQATYFTFAKLLPLANPRALDHQLYNFDIAHFGVEPAVFFDRFVSPATTEWFAFFYFGYFFVLAAHVVPILLISRSERTVEEFATGMVLMFCIGHTLYMFVPGFGPYKAMPELFVHPLSPGFWWDTTRDLVARSGAQKDIFPSLHTAAPTFLVLFSFHRRRELPYRYTWPLVAFFAANIIIATMFLRWHYVIDVMAGLLLAVTAHTLAVRLTRREAVRRGALGLGPMWPHWPGSRG